MATKMTGLCLVLCLFLGVVQCLPEQGEWAIAIGKDNSMGYTVKSLYNQSTVAIKIECSSPEEIDVSIQWVMRWTPCAEEYMLPTSGDSERIGHYFTDPGADMVGFNPGTIYYLESAAQTFKCWKEHRVIVLHDDSDKEWSHNTPIPVPSAKTNATKPAAGSEAAKSRKKRDAVEGDEKPHTEAPKATEKAESTPAATAAAKSPEHPADKINNVAATYTTPAYIAAVTEVSESETEQLTYFDAVSGNEHIVAKVPRDGSYLFIIEITQADETKPATYNATVTIKMKGPHGYLSAIEWPLLPFYGAMCLVYIVYGLVWLVLIMCNWRDLLRIQFWIGGVIFLGMLEKAIFFAEYESINATGVSVKGAMVFAELVSCAKRTLARMLVVIVSLGFGIVKPRLGPMLHRVLLVGALYFILASVEASLRVLKPKGDISRQTLLAGIPLAIIDATICWWVFTSLVQTTRTLRLRRNLVKLSLYRHFTNTLIFAVLASVAFMIWSIKEHRFASCLTDWKEMWVDDAFWHLLFSIILLVIMILWRPTINNQRYAFSPLLDAADDEEEEEPMITDAYEGMKMRGKGQNGSPIPRDSKSKAEEDLKWIEENIPATVSDTALPSLLDSDEEIMTTRFEMSKME